MMRPIKKPGYMKTFLASFGWLLLLLPFISVAGTRTLLHSIQSSISTDERQVSGFTGISSSGSYDVYIKMGTTERLRIEGDEELIKNIETSVEKGILKIRNSKNTGWTWNRQHKPKIYITAININNLAISGSGSMHVSGIIKTSSLNTQVSGSGSISATIQTSELNAAVSGSGSIQAAGNTSTASIAVSGSGRFDGKNLKTRTADVKVSGSGSVSVDADEQLNAASSGSGNIVYSGNAKVNQSKSGSGRIVRR